jgi:hypothetical protein
VKKYIQQLVGLSKIANYWRQESDKIKMLSSQPLIHQIKANAGKLKNIQEAEFSVFSQWGDDGIIQYLIHTLEIENKTFIEFGVENYREANTRFLLMNDNWSGLVIDGSDKNVAFIKNDSISHLFDLTAISKFLDKENLNTTIENAGFVGDIGLLHIDVDGNDYWLWECLTIVKPEIVIMEYNSTFGNNEAISVPYKSDFFVTKEHYSNLYFGASIKAFEFLANKKGYSLVGSNSNGNNAYFVRNDKIKGLTKMNSDSAYVQSKFKQNRNLNNELTLIRDSTMIKNCFHLPVVNVVTNEIIKLGDCYND